MIQRVVSKIFGTKHERDLKRMAPLVDEINRIWQGLSGLTDEELAAKTDEFKHRVKDGATLDELLPEVYAVVKETCKRLVGRKWSVCEQETTWDMVPYDVQLIGAVVLNEGKIAEMATGEGKTLVATMPLYLNALAGRGAHLVTVNDYLARRDSEWMGEIYKFLGLSVGCIQNDMDSTQRRTQYEADITYGTNNEFGFDYLRDNMAVRLEDRVQRGHHYAIVDEVDSVLIDEARTPLIISGAVSHSTQRYSELKPDVQHLVRNQTALANRLISEVEELLKDGGDTYEVGIKLLQVQRGAPKNKRFLKVMKDSSLKKLIMRVEADFLREKRLHLLDEELYFSIDEKSHSVSLSEKGRENLSPRGKSLFMLPDLSEELGRISEDESLSEKEKAERKEDLYRLHAETSEKIHNIYQLLKAYSLFEKDVEYVVKDGRVLIVDEFTGRLMPGRRYSDGLHQALEAKEGVKVEGETQTLATITLQNYFRMYEKLAGMTGTAETEASEFYEIYKLDVVVIPTNESVRRVDYQDAIFRTRREKLAQVINEIERMYNKGRPVLVGTVSVEVSETLSRLLKRKGIEHSVLNAKYHKMEAEIVAKAGRAGAVTIATNMAGRGTDIKLGEGVVKCEKCCVICDDDCSKCDHENMREKCMADMDCGLHIVGTERHESRRIDRQLRGRSGRQGDPGSSRFFLSLEDDLMRLFGSDRIASVMSRLGVQDGEVIQHPMVTKAIGRAQKRVEAYNFDIRKHLLEYDDVMNQQREVIYSRRLRALEGEELTDEIREMIGDLVEEKVDEFVDEHRPSEDWDLDSLEEELKGIFLHDFGLKQFGERRSSKEEVLDFSLERAKELYANREKELGSDIMRELERLVSLRIIDEAWKDHLYEIDQLKEGIGLRAYGQKDPLIEYKSEAFRAFVGLDQKLAQETLKLVMRADVRRAPAPPREVAQPAAVATHAQVSAFAGGAPPPAGGEDIARSQKLAPVRRAVQKVGRNDPCPCGSGKKYKKCCLLKEQG
ncbi:MAG: preprotein translocase subunit SecA [Latescibacteria bacterium DG_63]|nr:MAG: preprotein translocase subunit SecA [Latescibacteria bacterium DG_63]